MIVIVDANIIISAIINPYGTIATLLSANPGEIEFIIPQFAITEINRHKKRICEKGKLSLPVFNQLLKNILNDILIFSDDEVSLDDVKVALVLTSNIDTNDYLYIAFAIGLNAILWTGDLKLHYALRKRKFFQTMTTAELRQILKGL